MRCSDPVRSQRIPGWPRVTQVRIIQKASPAPDPPYVCFCIYYRTVGLITCNNSVSTRTPVATLVSNDSDVKLTEFLLLAAEKRILL